MSFLMRTAPLIFFIQTERKIGFDDGSDPSKHTAACTGSSRVLSCARNNCLKLVAVDSTSQKI